MTGWFLAVVLWFTPDGVPGHAQVFGVAQSFELCQRAVAERLLADPVKVEKNMADGFTPVIFCPRLPGKGGTEI